MKLSSRKQLLKEADDVLKDISRRRVDELDWEKHKQALQEPEGIRDKNFIEWKLKKELGLIERKYKYINDPVSRQKEIDELLQFAEKLKKHVSKENFKEIPNVPEQQTELQKLIVNAPPIPKGSSFIKNYIDWVVKDPETGMYYSKISGEPTMPPEWEKDSLEYSMDFSSDVQYDYSRGWLYNFLRGLLRGEGPGA